MEKKNTDYNTLVKEIITAGKEFGSLELGDGDSVSFEVKYTSLIKPLKIVDIRKAFVANTFKNIFSLLGYHAKSALYIRDLSKESDLFGQIMNTVYLSSIKKKIDYEVDEHHKELFDFAESHCKEIVDIFDKSLLKNNDNTRKKKLKEYVMSKNLKKFENLLDDLNINFDLISCDSIMRKSGSCEDIMSIFDDNQLIYEQDDKRYVATKYIGDEKDHQLTTESNLPTEYLCNLAYYFSKLNYLYVKLYDIIPKSRTNIFNDIRYGIEALKLNYKPKISTIEVTDRKNQSADVIQEKIDKFGLPVVKFQMLKTPFRKELSLANMKLTDLSKVIESMLEIYRKNQVLIKDCRECDELDVNIINNYDLEVLNECNELSKVLKKVVEENDLTILFNFVMDFTSHVEKFLTKKYRKKEYQKVKKVVIKAINIVYDRIFEILELDID